MSQINVKAIRSIAAHLEDKTSIFEVVQRVSLGVRLYKLIDRSVCYGAAER